MPYRFEYDAIHKILLVVLEGEVEDRDLSTGLEGIRARVGQLNPTAGITDFSAITAFSASGQSVRAAAALPDPYPPETPRFVIAPADYLFGIARMYELVANRPNAMLKVVRSREEAYAILGIQDPKFERLP
jgi:hypothetical protein